jgi:hypothetical protein
VDNVTAKNLNKGINEVIVKAAKGISRDIKDAQVGSCLFVLRDDCYSTLRTIDAQVGSCLFVLRDDCYSTLRTINEELDIITARGPWL